MTSDAAESHRPQEQTCRTFFADAGVTILGYGAMELRGLPRGPEVADEDAGRLLNAVLDSGINLMEVSN